MFVLGWFVAGLGAIWGIEGFEHQIFECPKKCWMPRNYYKEKIIFTTKDNGLVVMSILSSTLGFESRNGKHLGLNPTTSAHDPLVTLWGWITIMAHWFLLDPTGRMLLWSRLDKKATLVYHFFLIKKIYFNFLCFRF